MNNFQNRAYAALTSLLLLLAVPAVANADTCVPDGTNPACANPEDYGLVEWEPEAWEEQQLVEQAEEDFIKQTEADRQLQDLVDELPPAPETTPQAPETPIEEPSTPPTPKAEPTPTKHPETPREPRETSTPKAPQMQKAPGLPKAGV